MIVVSGLTLEGWELDDVDNVFFSLGKVTLRDVQSAVIWRSLIQRSIPFGCAAPGLHLPTLRPRY